jgi:hypothetical protein
VNGAITGLLLGGLGRCVRPSAGFPVAASMRPADGRDARLDAELRPHLTRETLRSLLVDGPAVTEPSLTVPSGVRTVSKTGRTFPSGRDRSSVTGPEKQNAGSACAGRRSDGWGRASGLGVTPLPGGSNSLCRGCEEGASDERPAGRAHARRPQALAWAEPARQLRHRHAPVIHPRRRASRQGVLGQVSA